jgi:hypothetical protein
MDFAVIGTGMQNVELPQGYVHLKNMYWTFIILNQKVGASISMINITQSRFEAHVEGSSFIRELQASPFF